VFFVPNKSEYLGQGAGTFIMLTSGTQETRASISGISFDYYYEGTDQYGNPDINSYYYIGTEWPAEPEIRLQLQVK
jgi:hypothetical protein